MKTIYAACLSRLGLTQTGAATLHDVRVDTVKSWCVGRTRVPAGIWDDLRAYELRIVDASEAIREGWDAASSPPIEIDDSEADQLGLMALADFVLGSTGPVHVGQTAATITDLRARIAELEADKAQWVENERMQLGISAHTPQSTPAHSPALTAAQGSTPPE